MSRMSCFFLTHGI